MTHIELIEQLYRYRDIIDRGYKEGELDSVPKPLQESTLFIKVGSKYRLNRSYISFVNFALDRVDYTVIFGDYEEEHRQIIINKQRYEDTKKIQYHQKVIDLINDIYLKFYYRDSQINSALKSLQRQDNEELDILIESANDILKQIREVVEANSKIANTFTQLKSVDIEFKKVLDELDNDFFKFLKNISYYIDRLNKFIIQTQTKRRLNRLFMQLSADILSENDTYLDEILMQYREGLYHTVKRYKNQIKVLPTEDDLPLLKRSLKSLRLLKPKREKANTILPTPQVKELNLIDIKSIVASLKTGCDDLYIYLLNHDIVKDENEAFLIYLHLISYPNVSFERTFNRYNVRITKWR